MSNNIDVQVIFGTFFNRNFIIIHHIYLEKNYGIFLKIISPLILIAKPVLALKKSYQITFDLERQNSFFFFMNMCLY